MRIWERFPGIAQRVRQKHEEVGLYGHHDWIHAFRVGEVAYQVAEAEWSSGIASIAGLAGLLHNADHVMQKKMRVDRRDVPPSVIATLIKWWLEGTPRVSGAVDYMVIDAVLKHDGKNSSDDSRVLIALMDADRIVNLDVDLFIRSGQRFHNSPSVDYQNYLGDPRATYQDPKSVLRDIAYSLDWVNPESPVCIRTRLGWKMAESRVKVFRTFFDALKAQLEEEGIHPYPFPS